MKFIFTFVLVCISMTTWAQRDLYIKLIDSVTKKPIVDGAIKAVGDASFSSYSAGNYHLHVDEGKDSLEIQSANYPVTYAAIPEEDTFVIELNKSNQTDAGIFMVVEESASPVGGMENFYKHIINNLVYPKEAKEKKIAGRVFVGFVVQPDGTIDQNSVEVIRGIHPACDAEAVRVVRTSPPWNPGKLEGKPVKQRMVLPINFSFEKKKDK